MMRYLLRSSRLPAVAACLLWAVGDRPAAAGEMEMVLDSVPPGAQVEQAGKVLGKTPLHLRYPTGYFQTRATVWGAFLGAPLEFTLTAPGYEPKVVKLGNGPNPWRNLYGQIIYQYYVLDHAYRVELTPERRQAAQMAAPGADTVSQLERLASLRGQGLLTEAEFQAAKARVLEGAPNATVADTGSTATAKATNPLEQQDPTALCWRLIAGAFPGAELAKQATPTREVSTAADGSDRQIVVHCSWGLAAPRPATLKIEVACGDAADPIALCNASERPAANANPACLWGDEMSARAVVRPQGCLIQGLFTTENRGLPPGFNPAAFDVRDVLRVMVGRL